MPLCVRLRKIRSNALLVLLTSRGCSQRLFLRRNSSRRVSLLSTDHRIRVLCLLLICPLCRCYHREGRSLPIMQRNHCSQQCHTLTVSLKWYGRFLVSPQQTVTPSSGKPNTRLHSPGNGYQYKNRIGN